jgi:hypothetical protein
MDERISIPESSRVYPMAWTMSAQDRSAKSRPEPPPGHVVNLDPLRTFAHWLRCFRDDVSGGCASPPPMS